MEAVFSDTDQERSRHLTAPSPFAADVGGGGGDRVGGGSETEGSSVASFEDYDDGDIEALMDLQLQDSGGHFTAQEPSEYFDDANNNTDPSGEKQALRDAAKKKRRRSSNLLVALLTKRKSLEDNELRSLPRKSGRTTTQSPQDQVKLDALLRVKSSLVRSTLVEDGEEGGSEHPVHGTSPHELDVFESTVVPPASASDSAAADASPRPDCPCLRQLKRLKARQRTTR